MTNHSTLANRVARRAAERGKALALPAVRNASTQLSSAMRIERRGPGRWAIHIPHYWAVFVHDGRGPFSAPNNIMIYFRDPKQDPRLIGGKTPQRAKNLRHLTKEGIRRANILNQRHLSRGGSPNEMPVVFLKRVRKRTPAKRFFENTPSAMGQLQPKVAIIAQQEMKQFVRKHLGDLFSQVDRAVASL